MARFTLVIHSTCASSRSLLHGLKERGLLDSVELRRADKPVYRGVFLWSVPMLVSPGGEPLGMDPLAPEEVEAVVRGEPVSPSGDLVEDFYTAVLYSSYATGLVLLHGGFHPLLEEASFLVPGLRLWARGMGLEEASRILAREAQGLYEERFEVLARAASIAYARNLYWAVGPDRLEESLASTRPEDVAFWLISFAGVGRSGLPQKPGMVEAAEYIAGFLQRRARGVARKILREQEELFSDKWFQDTVTKALPV